MPTPFSRSLRSVESDGGRLLRWLAAPVLLLLAAGGWWTVAAEVPLYAASSAARVVHERAVHPLQSALDGRVLAVHVALDDEVAAGDVVLELDPREQDLALDEERARLGALDARLAATRKALDALAAARAQASAAARAVRTEAELELQARTIALRFALEEAARFGELETTGDVSHLSSERARAEAEQADLAVQAQEALLVRLDEDGARADGDRAAELAERERELADLAGQRDVTRAAIARLEHAVASCTIRAPAAGRVGELAALTPGAWVAAGDRLGAVVSETRLAVEAEFAPAEALGKVRLGQHGELALAGFPRAQFGTVDVSVERIASEARDGRIRVELALPSPDAARVPLEHGLPGTVRIEVERTAPLMLLVRAVGGAFGASSDAGTSP